MATDIRHSQLSFRAKYARRLIREKIFLELVELGKSRTPDGQFRAPTLPTLPIPRDPFSLPHDKPRPSDGPVKSPPNLGAFKFCIIGAGVAGLYLAMILSDAGIPYDLVEASDRVGGRMYTKKFSETPHDYYDIGAMRYPQIPLMQKLFNLFTSLKVPLIPYYLDGVKCPEMYNDILGPPDNAKEFDHYKISVENGGVVPDKAVSAGVQYFLNLAFDPYKDLLKKDFEAGFKVMQETVDKYSTREYLRSHLYDDKFGLDFNTIQWLETNNTSSGLFDQAFTESVIDSLDFDYSDDVKWWCIEGGTIKLTEAMLQKITQKPQLRTTVKRIALKRPEDNSNSKVIVEMVDSTGKKVTQEYDTVFNTTTLACAQRIDLTDAELHPAQKDALRALHYDSSSKVAIQFKTPWWITKCGITEGGVASSDIPLRTCVYPSYNLHDDPTKTAVLLASYTWAQDAQRIASLIQPDSPEGEDTLKELILRDLARLHKKSGITYEYLCAEYNTHHAFDWYHDPYTSGAFALFGPGQFQNMYPFITRPAADSKLHFVGEASSAHHAWIVGALDSAERAFMHTMLRFGLREEAEKVEAKWGNVGEVEIGREGTAHLQVALGTLRPGEIIRV